MTPPPLRARFPGARLDLSAWHHPGYVHRLVATPDGALLLSCGEGLLAADIGTGERRCSRVAPSRSR